MHLKTLAPVFVFVGTALATTGPALAMKGVMSYNDAFGLAKRQSGYYPSSRTCGSGDTCADACGSNYSPCSSTDGRLHCYQPGEKQTCCPNGSGLPCDDGYYCSEDSAHRTYCCPQGTSLSECANIYSVSALQSQTSAAATSAPAAESSAPAESAKASVTSETSAAVGTVPPTITSPGLNISVTAPTASLAIFTGAAAIARGGQAVLPALALGLAGVIAL